MSIPAAWPQVLDFFGTPLVIEPTPGQLSSDAGLLPVRQFDHRVGLTRTFAAALDDAAPQDDVAGPLEPEREDRHGPPNWASEARAWRWAVPAPSRWSASLPMSRPMTDGMQIRRTCSTAARR